MHEVALDLLILLAGIWLVAVTLRPLGLPTVMGELIVGVVVGPAVLGLIQPSEAVQLLAEIGIFFLMFHAGVETQPVEFFEAMKRSMGVAVVGAIVPFAVGFGVASYFGLDRIGATFVALTMTATAVVITLTALKDLGLANTRVARVIVASCVIDDLLTMVFFGVVVGVLTGGGFEIGAVLISLGKVIGFLVVLFLVGHYVYPRLTLPFRSEGGKGFTFVLLTAIAAGLFAEAIGLHMILGAYLAGLFFGEHVAHPNLLRVVKDRAYGIAYSFLGPIFFISLGFSITFDISRTQVAFLALLTGGVIVGQIASAGGMALRMGLPRREALTVGVGMCGRAELAFILAALALSQGAIDQGVFSVLIFTAFLLNLFTPLALKGCAEMLHGSAARLPDATRGVLQIEKFADTVYSSEALAEIRLTTRLPEIEGGVVVYGYGPEVASFMAELDLRGIPSLVIEEDEDRAQRLQDRGMQVVLAHPAMDPFDLSGLVHARGLVTNSKDDHSAVLAMSARERGFEGPIVAMIDNPNRRSAMMLAGATVTFTPDHVLAAVLAARASSKIGPRVAGVGPLHGHLEVAELRVHDASPLANRTLASAAIREKTGANIVGQWSEGRLGAAPTATERLVPGTILVAAGSPESIARLGDLTRPITHQGPLVIVGYGAVGEKLRELLTDAGEEVFVLAETEGEGVDRVGDVFDHEVLETAPIRQARAVILSLESEDDRESETLLATRVVRDHAPEVPILASVGLVENVERVQEAGADYALSVSQVAGQLLARHVLGEAISLQPRIKLVRHGAGRLAGKNPFEQEIRERSGCTIVAVERDGEVLTTAPTTLELGQEDALYVCGTAEALTRYEQTFGTQFVR